MRGTAAITLTLLLLQVLVAEANHELAPLHVHLFAGGLYVTLSALVLPLGPGLAASILGGLMCDANAPVAFGTHALLWALAHGVIHGVRARMDEGDPAFRLLVALFANLALFLALTSVEALRMSAPALHWPRLAADLGWSELALAIGGPTFFALQAQALRFADGYSKH